MSEETRKEQDTFEKMNMIENAFTTLFSDNIAHIETKLVKVGGTSGTIYVPKKYDGCPVTVIIWDKEKVKSAEKKIQKEFVKEKIAPENEVPIIPRQEF